MSFPGPSVWDIYRCRKEALNKFHVKEREAPPWPSMRDFRLFLHSLSLANLRTKAIYPWWLLPACARGAQWPLSGKVAPVGGGNSTRRSQLRRAIRFNKSSSLADEFSRAWPRRAEDLKDWFAKVLYRLEYCDLQFQDVEGVMAILETCE